jgi:hypothetical protein
MKNPKLLFLLNRKWKAELFQLVVSAAERLIISIMQDALQNTRHIA